jgi:uncharacterized RDD family membrane protein YckC
VKCKICGQDNPTEARFCGNCGATLVVTIEPPSRAAVPSPIVVAPAVTVEYMGFWIRFAAAIIDGAILLIISSILIIPLGFIYWPVIVPDIFLFWLYYWLFTGLKGQTPGKMAVGIKVVNYQGDRPGLGSAALREVLGKLISTVVLCIGFLWIAFDDNKQGWYDKIANTYVVKVESRR